MNEVMENMNELKDKLFAAIDTICKDYEAKKPEFKVPGWYLYRDNMGLIVFYATKIDGNYFKNDSGEMWFIKDCRPATPQEIEFHLRKIAEEKGFKKGVKYYDIHGQRVTIIQNPGFVYFACSDILAIKGIDPTLYDVLYSQGQWAEIIPDKKKLPCTRDEAIKLIQEYTAYYRKDSGCNVFDFISSYTV